ncbi:hypothetical protein [Actinacidiphila epipremni]|uniref:Uncharacterized protein n=1 Tax=Actinacidiphila epipremni TaxID=2053013 RepID=A0ABX0ZWF4_9ACTN|nr:hypothetical protein [Actinacidiphila epipremni]NJP47092.1 hypothetical protein [Actinacidiphila epipremni]
MVRRQFDAHSPSDLVPSENTDLVSLGVGKSRNADLTYLPAAVLETTDSRVPAETAAIAVELGTSSRGRAVEPGRLAVWSGRGMAAGAHDDGDHQDWS